MQQPFFMMGAPGTVPPPNVESIISGLMMQILNAPDGAMQVARILQNGPGKTPLEQFYFTAAMRIHASMNRQHNVLPAQRAAAIGAAAPPVALRPAPAPPAAPTAPPPPPVIEGNPLDTISEAALLGAARRTLELITEAGALVQGNNSRPGNAPLPAETRARVSELCAAAMPRCQLLARLTDTPGFSALPRAALQETFEFAELPPRLQAQLWPARFVAEAEAARVASEAAAAADALGYDWSSLLLPAASRGAPGGEVDVGGGGAAAAEAVSA